MSDLRLKLHVDNTRAVGSAVDNINKKLDRMVQNAMRASVAMSAAMKSINVNAQSASANMAIAKVSNAEGRKVAFAKQTTEKLKREYDKRAESELRALQRTSRQWEKEEERKTRATQRAADKQAKANQRKAGKSDWGGLRSGAIGAGLGIGASVLGASAAITYHYAKENMEIDKRLMGLRIQGRNPGEAGVGMQDLQNATHGTATKYGRDTGDVVSAMESIVSKTGDMKFALSSLDVIGKASMATGADMKDLGSVAADLMQKFDIKTPEELNAALATLAMQGKKGAFELKNMAEEFPEIAAAAANYGLRGSAGMNQLGGMAQIARTGTGTAAEASTATRMLFSDLTHNAGKLKAAGINVFDKNNRGKDLTTLLPDIIAKTKGDPTKLQDYFNERSIKAMSPLNTEYNKTREAAIGRGATVENAEKEAKAAVSKMIAEAIAANSAVEELDRDAAEMQKGNATKIASAWAQVQAKFAEIDWTPLIDAMPNVVSALTALANVVNDIVEFFDTITGNKEEKARKRQKDAVDSAAKSIEELSKPTTRAATEEEFNKKETERKAALARARDKQEGALNAQRSYNDSHPIAPAPVETIKPQLGEGGAITSAREEDVSNGPANEIRGPAKSLGAVLKELSATIQASNNDIKNGSTE